jgi:hypothetical protein
MSFQSPVVWWYREVNCEAVGMCVEAVPVLGAESAEFLFNWCELEILSEDHIRHVPWCVRYHGQEFPLEAFQYFDVGEHKFDSVPLLVSSRNDIRPDTQLQTKRRKKSTLPPSCVKFCKLTPKICWYYLLPSHHATTTAAQTATSVPEIMDTPSYMACLEILPLLYVKFKILTRISRSWSW